MSFTYDPADLTVTIGGEYITGFSEDMVTLEVDEDNHTTKVGAQGDVMVSRNHSPLATLTLTLLGGSDSIDYLNQLARSVEKVPISIIYNGTPKEVTTITEAIVKKPSGRTYGKESEDREFEIACLDYDMV